MAMLISKFHKLIQSKLLWASFLVIVVFTFVVWGTQVPKSAKAAEKASSPGSLNGEPVPLQRFREAYYNTYLTVVMAMSQAINITPRIDAQLRQAAWQRLAALNEAAKLGLSASDDEVAAAIQQHEGFSTDGRFNKAIYKSFVQNFLVRMGFTERQFEEHVRQEIVLQKLRSIVDRMTLVTPLELRRAFNSVTDRFKVDYVIITPKVVENDVKVTRDDARAFFDKDPSAFTIPEKVQVKYVEVPSEPFVPKVKLTEEEVQAYYEDHLDEFEKPELTNETANAEGTNDFVEAKTTNEAAEAGTSVEAAVESDTNALLSSETKYKPFEDVKQDISNELIQKGALAQASDQAMNFVVALTPDRDGVAMSFEDAAKQFGLAVKKTKPFAERDNVPRVEAGLAFNRAAFELTEGSEGYFSNPVEGSNTVYVLALEKRIASRVPTFDEVEDEVTPKARDQALADALTRRAQQVRDAVDQALQDGTSFSNAVEALGLTPEETKEFSSTTGLQDDEYGDILLRGVLTRNAGELTDLLPARDAVLVGYVAERKPAEATTYDSLKQQLIGTIRRQYGRVTFDGWEEYLLKQAQFEERARPEDETAPEEEEPATNADES